MSEPIWQRIGRVDRLPTPETEIPYRLVAEGDEIQSKNGKWYIVLDGGLSRDGAKMVLRLKGSSGAPIIVKPPADNKVMCRRGATGVAVDLLVEMCSVIYTGPGARWTEPDEALAPDRVEDE
jgi:hypothetical protein